MKCHICVQVASHTYTICLEFTWKVPAFWLSRQIKIVWLELTRAVSNSRCSGCVAICIKRVFVVPPRSTPGLIQGRHLFDTPNILVLLSLWFLEFLESLTWPETWLPYSWLDKDDIHRLTASTLELHHIPDQIRQIRRTPFHVPQQSLLGGASQCFALLWRIL